MNFCDISFYNSISEHYREIFPLKPAQTSFVRQAFPNASNQSLLDVGCGTGDLTVELSSSSGRVTGIDLDRAMLLKARETVHNNVEFLNLNMLDILEQFGNAAFNGVLCFGNTLVHLNDLSSISEFIFQARKVLTTDGKLLLQIINYDWILDQKVPALPTLDTDYCSFERNYKYDPELHRISFETLLKIKASGQTIRNIIPLYPLRKTELQAILVDAGFTSVSYFGNFQRAPLKSDSIPLVVEAC